MGGLGFLGSLILAVERISRLVAFGPGFNIHHDTFHHLSCPVGLGYRVSGLSKGFRRFRDSGFGLGAECNNLKLEAGVHHFPEMRT